MSHSKKNINTKEEFFITFKEFLVSLQDDKNQQLNAHNYTSRPEFHSILYFTHHYDNFTESEKAQLDQWLQAQGQETMYCTHYAQLVQHRFVHNQQYVSLKLDFSKLELAQLKEIPISYFCAVLNHETQSSVVFHYLKNYFQVNNLENIETQDLGSQKNFLAQLIFADCLEKYPEQLPLIFKNKYWSDEEKISIFIDFYQKNKDNPQNINVNGFVYSNFVFYLKQLYKNTHGEAQQKLLPYLFEASFKNQSNLEPLRNNPILYPFFEAQAAYLFTQLGAQTFPEEFKVLYDPNEDEHTETELFLFNGFQSLFISMSQRDYEHSQQFFNRYKTEILKPVVSQLYGFERETTLSEYFFRRKNTGLLQYVERSDLSDKEQEMLGSLLVFDFLSSWSEDYKSGGLAHLEKISSANLQKALTAASKQLGHFENPTRSQKLAALNSILEARVLSESIQPENTQNKPKLRKV